MFPVLEKTLYGSSIETIDIDFIFPQTKLENFSMIIKLEQDPK